ncbi:MAG: hypothetical protein JO204_04300 [Alphaproteobacteria bacterium]|nr:hypothetical protein [Alphaproteobacteria bacterium]
MERRRRRAFTDDYKRQAVDLVASSGRSADAFRPIHDCVIMSKIAAQLMSDADDGKHPELCFAVLHLNQMFENLKLRYNDAWHGERWSE